MGDFSIGTMAGKCCSLIELKQVRLTPLIAGLILTSKCNLHCQHCRVSNIGRENLSFEDSIAVLNSFYKEGRRSIYFQGGEPFMWHDGEHSLEYLVRGIFFYIHTPYYRYDDLYIEPTGKNEILHKLLGYKKKYKILNSKAGLKSALNNEWKRPHNIYEVL